MSERGKKNEGDKSADLLIQEVNEDLRREQYERLWKKYGGYVIGAAAFVIIFVAGTQGYNAWRGNLSQSESSAYSAAQSLAEQGELEQAALGMAALAEDGKTGYEMLARLREGGILAKAGKTDQAIAAYDAVAGDSGNPALYRDLATLLSANLRIDSAEPAVLEAEVAPMLAAANPYRWSATEMTALLALRQGDTQRALDLYQSLVEDAGTPGAMRDRAAEMAQALQAQTGKTEG